MIIASIEILATGRLGEKVSQIVRGHGKVALRFASVGEAGLVQDLAERQESVEDELAQLLRETVEQDLDHTVLDRATAGRSVKHDFAKVKIIVLLGLKNLEGDGFGVESFQRRGHVVVVDEQFVIGRRDLVPVDPMQRGLGNVRARQDGRQLGGQGG